MKALNFIAGRYLFSRRKFQFVSMLAWISVGGITIGLASLIVVMSVMNGFRGMQERGLIGFDPHIVIYGASDEVLEKLARDEEVADYSKFIETKVLFGFGENTGGAKLLLYESDGFSEKFVRRLQSGGYPKDAGLIVGGALAMKYKFFPGDTLSFMTPKALEESAVRFRPSSPELAAVSGIFYANTKAYDEYYMIGGDWLKRKLKMGKYEGVAVNLKDAMLSETYAKELEALSGESEIRTWKEENAQLLGIMEFERYATFAILSLIIILAVFNLLVSISMTMLEKRSDAAILQVFGAEFSFIKKLFFRLGFVTGMIGTVLGSIIGLLAVYLQKEIGWIPVANSSNVMMPDVPVELDIVEITFAISFAVLLTAISSMLPSRYLKGESLTKRIVGDN